MISRDDADEESRLPSRRIIVTFSFLLLAGTSAKSIRNANNYAKTQKIRETPRVVSSSSGLIRDAQRFLQSCITSRVSQRTIASCPLAVNNPGDLPRCNVARVNKSKPEMTRCGVASIFRCSRPLRLESSSSPLLPRTAATMAHVHTHEPHARTYIRSAIRKEHCEAQRRLSSPADPLCSQLGDPWLFTIAIR